VIQRGGGGGQVFQREGTFKGVHPPTNYGNHPQRHINPFL
jgi:hypothetical protein